VHIVDTSKRVLGEHPIQSKQCVTWSWHTKIKQEERHERRHRWFSYSFEGSKETKIQESEMEDRMRATVPRMQSDGAVEILGRKERSQSRSRSRSHWMPWKSKFED
jgi:hypothetical protein